MKLIIVGAGGHATVVADAALAAAANGTQIELVGFVDREPASGQQAILGVPILGDESALERVPHDGVVIAVGNNRARLQVVERLRTRGERFLSVVHPSAVIGRDVHIGDGAMICGGVVVNPGTRIGSHVILNTSCSIDHHNTIGDCAHVAPGAHTGGSVHIGDGALIAIGAVVLPGVRVGAWATVGAGAAAIRDVAPGVTVVGVPSKSIGSVSSS